tara:strand:- start:16 stop:801 length:786 start_codon:yes stop_codon:yes gene_type:complete
MRAAKNLCPKPKKPVAMKSGGQAAKKVKKVVKGLKKASKTHAKQAKTLSSLKLNKGGRTGKVDQYKTTNPRYSGLKTGSIMQRAMTKGKGSSYRDQGTFTSASPAEAREEKARERSRQKSKKIIGDNPLKTPNVPIKREQSKDAKRVADIKRRQKTASAVRKKKSEISRKGRGGGGGRSAVGMGIRPPVLGPTRKLKMLKSGGKSKSRVNEAGNYTKPTMRKRLFNRIKAGGKGGAPGQWSARKAQMLASAYKKAGGGYRN